MDAIGYGNESDNDIISTDMLEEISDINQSHPNFNWRDTCYKIRDRIRKR